MGLKRQSPRVSSEYAVDNSAILVTVVCLVEVFSHVGLCLSAIHCGAGGQDEAQRAHQHVIDSLQALGEYPCEASTLAKLAFLLSQPLKTVQVHLVAPVAQLPRILGPLFALSYLVFRLSTSASESSTWWRRIEVTYLQALALNDTVLPGVLQFLLGPSTLTTHTLHILPELYTGPVCSALLCMPPGFVIFYSLCTVIGAGLSSIVVGRNAPNASPFAQRQWFGPVVDCVLAGAAACAFSLYRSTIWRLISTRFADLFSVTRSFGLWRPGRRSRGIPAGGGAVGNRSHAAPRQGSLSRDAVESAAATGCSCGHSGSELTATGTPLLAAARPKDLVALAEDAANDGKSFCKHSRSACTCPCTTAAAAGTTPCQGGLARFSCDSARCRRSMGCRFSKFASGVSGANGNATATTNAAAVGTAVSTELGDGQRPPERAGGDGIPVSESPQVLTDGPVPTDLTARSYRYEPHDATALCVQALGSLCVYDMGCGSWPNYAGAAPADRLPMVPALAGVSTTAAATPAVAATVAPLPSRVRVSSLEHARSLVSRAAMCEYVSSMTLQRVVVRVPDLSPQALPDGWLDAVHAQLVQRYPDMHVLNISVRHGSLILVLEVAVPGEAVGGRRLPSQEPTTWSQVDASTATAVATSGARSSSLLPPQPPLQSQQQQHRRAGWRRANGPGTQSGTCGAACVVAAAGPCAGNQGGSISPEVVEAPAAEGEETKAAVAGLGVIAASEAESGAQHKDGWSGGGADKGAFRGSGSGGGAGGRGVERDMALDMVWATLESSLPHLQQGAIATVEDGRGGVSLYQYDAGAAEWQLLSCKLQGPAGTASRQPPVSDGGAGDSAGGGEGGSGDTCSGVGGGGAVRAALPGPALLWMALDDGVGEGLAARVVVQPPVLVVAPSPPVQPPHSSFAMGGAGALDAADVPPCSSATTSAGVHASAAATAFATTVTASTTSATSTTTATCTTSEPTTTKPAIANAAVAVPAATSSATSTSAAAYGAATAASMAAGTAPSLEQQPIGAAGAGLQLAVRLNLDVYAAVLAPLAANLTPTLSTSLPAVQASATRSPLPAVCRGQFGGHRQSCTASQRSAATPPCATATVIPGGHDGRLPLPDAATAVHTAATAATVVSELSVWLRLAVPNGRTPLLYRRQKLELVALAPEQRSSGCAAPAAATVNPAGEGAPPGIPQPEELQPTPQGQHGEQHPQPRMPAPVAGGTRPDPGRAPVESTEAAIQAVEDERSLPTGQRLPVAPPAAARLDRHPCGAQHPRPPLQGHLTLLGCVSSGELEPWMQLAATAAEGSCGPCLLHCEVWHDPTGLMCGSAPVLVLPSLARSAAVSPAAAPTAGPVADVAAATIGMAADVAALAEMYD